MTPSPAAPVTELQPEPWFLDHCLQEQLNPFEIDLTDIRPEMLPEDQLLDSSNPIAAYVIGMLVVLDESEIPANVRRGLKDLVVLQYKTPLVRLAKRTVSRDEETVRSWGLAAAEARMERAEQEPDSVLKDRRMAAAMVSIERRGYSRWQDYLSAIGAVRRFAADLGMPTAGLPPHPTRGLHGVVEESDARRALESWEMDVLWDAASHHQDPDLALMVLDFVRETAARRQAVIDLTLDDIHWSESFVVLHTKFRQRVEIPVSQDLLERIAIRAAELGWDGQYSAPRGKWSPNPSRAAFRKLDAGALTARWFDSMFNLIERQTRGKLEVRFTTHWLRHTTLSQVDQIAGANVAAQWAGHRNGGHGPSRGNAISQYVRWPVKDLKAVHRMMFPNTPPGAVDPKTLTEKFAWLDRQESLEPPGASGSV